MTIKHKFIFQIYSFCFSVNEFPMKNSDFCILARGSSFSPEGFSSVPELISN